MTTTELKVEELIAEGVTQARTYSEKLVERYAEAMKDGAVFPPIVVFVDGSGKYVGDGHHRVGAAKKVGRKTIAARVHGLLDVGGKKESAQRSAILYAVGANDEHGQNRSDADKRHAVEMLLRDPEWSLWTDREISRQCRVSHTFVTTQRTRLVNKGVLSGDRKRKTTRGGKVYEMDTGNIGKSKPKKPKKRPAKKELTSEQKKVAQQFRESEKRQQNKQQAALRWTAEDEASYAVLEDAWKAATGPAREQFLREHARSAA